MKFRTFTLAAATIAAAAAFGAGQTEARPGVSFGIGGGGFHVGVYPRSYGYYGDSHYYGSPYYGPSYSYRSYSYSAPSYSYRTYGYYDDDDYGYRRGNRVRTRQHKFIYESGD